MVSRKLTIVIILALLVGGGLLGAFVLLPNQKYQCGPQSMVQSTQLTPAKFGAVTKYQLPANRSPNGIVAAPDGSVWFGELGVPGVAHLYPENGTLVEYRWPFDYPKSSIASSDCSDWTDTWGVAIWNGMVWAPNQDNSSLVGLNPSNDTFETVRLNSTSQPYTLAVGPENNLWFTDLSYPARIGSVDSATHQVTYYDLPNGSQSASAYLLFQNSTLGYVLSIYPDTGGGSLYSFDPTAQNPTFELVGGNETVPQSRPSSAMSTGVGGGPSTPTSVAIGEGGIWLAEHSGSDMEFYNESAMRWEVYPTSVVSYVPWTLPYFDVSNGSAVWFNEHYGNRLSEICCNASALTEYNLSDPPVTNITKIGNALTIAAAGSRVWFTEWTAGYVGFVDTTYKPSFSISLNSSSTIEMQPGTAATTQLELGGESSKNLSLQFSDSEQTSATPQDISFNTSVQALPSLNGEQTVAVTISASQAIRPGQYTALMTVTDGLISRSVYLTIIITA